MFPFRFFYLSTLLMGLTDPSEETSLTWSPSNTEKSFHSYYMTLFAKFMLLNKHIYRFIISNDPKKGLMVWTKKYILGWKTNPCIMKGYKCILDKLLLVRERIKLELKSIFMWIERQFIVQYLINIFVGFYLWLADYENKVSGYEWDHEVAQQFRKYHDFLGIAKTIFPGLSSNVEIFL